MAATMFFTHANKIITDKLYMDTKLPWLSPVVTKF